MFLVSLVDKGEDKNEDGEDDNDDKDCCRTCGTDDKIIVLPDQPIHPAE
jgi:hypothetical protein